MTHRSDPPRWTRSPEQAPELLQSGLRAVSREGPSPVQMRALAVKLAAVGSGTAVAASAASAKASAGLAATGSSALSKVMMSMAVIGLAATGGGLLLHRAGLRDDALLDAHVEQTSEGTTAETEPSLAAPQLAQPSYEGAPVVGPVVEPLSVEAEPAIVEPSAIEATPAELSRAERRRLRHERAEARHAAQGHGRHATNAPFTSTIVQVKGERVQLGEIELLTRARAALAARPRDAYRLSETHKSLYPEGVFAQERDTLAVEALQRAGDLHGARELAEAFLVRYPDSPAAHRFRETMNLP